RWELTDRALLPKIPGGARARADDDGAVWGHVARGAVVHEDAGAIGSPAQGRRRALRRVAASRDDHGAIVAQTNATDVRADGMCWPERVEPVFVPESKDLPVEPGRGGDTGDGRAIA